MQPQDAIVTVRITRWVPRGMTVDGNTPLYETVEETELVNAKVWPVSMGPDEMLVEYEDGTLNSAKLRDIRIGNRV